MSERPCSCTSKSLAGYCVECRATTCLDCHERVRPRDEVTTAVVWCIECHWAEAQANGLPMWRTAALAVFDAGDEDRRPAYWRAYRWSYVVERDYMFVAGRALHGMEAS